MGYSAQTNASRGLVWGPRVSNRHFSVTGFQVEIVSKQTVRIKQNDPSCRDRCLRGCSMVPVLSLMPPEQPFRSVSA